MHVYEFNQSTQGTRTNNTATGPTASEPEKEHGSEKKEPQILIIGRT